MTEHQVLVSIITPAYNAEKYIAETIESVLHQTYADWELLVIDDGSTDSTANIVKSYADARIILVQQENGGVSRARNKGLDLAKGKYITFLDADDVFPLDSLRSRVEYLEFYPNVDLVDGKVCVKDLNMQHEIRLYQPYYSGELLPRLLALDSRVFVGICYMFRSKIMGDMRFKDKMSHAEDLLFYMMLSNNCPVHYGFVDEVVYFARSGATSSIYNLEGMEKGFLLLLSEINSLERISYFQNFILRIKIARIVFLGWLKQKNFSRAFRSSFSAINIFR